VELLIYIKSADFGVILGGSLADQLRQDRPLAGFWSLVETWVVLLLHRVSETAGFSHQGTFLSYLDTLRNGVAVPLTHTCCSAELDLVKASCQARFDYCEHPAHRHGPFEVPCMGAPTIYLSMRAWQLAYYQVCTEYIVSTIHISTFVASYRFIVPD